MSAIKEVNPNVSVVVNYTDLPFILNVFKNRTLNTMEKIAIEEKLSLIFFNCSKTFLFKTLIKATLLFISVYYIN